MVALELVGRTFLSAFRRRTRRRNRSADSCGGVPPHEADTNVRPTKVHPPLRCGRRSSTPSTSKWWLLNWWGGHSCLPSDAVLGGGIDPQIRVEEYLRTRQTRMSAPPKSTHPFGMVGVVGWALPTHSLWMSALNL